MGEVTDMGYWDNGHMDDGWGIVMMVGMLSIWALVAVGVVWIVRSTRTPGVTSTVPSGASTATASGSVTASAEQILAERLARGDIDPEEYQTRLDALTSRRAP
jgi:putative membrane protein